MEKKCQEEWLARLEAALREDEKSAATVEKYRRDALAFLRFAETETALTKDLVVAYKRRLAESYAVTSANSMLAAINYFLRAVGRPDCTVKAFKLQRETFRREERELTKTEYFRLLNAARQKGDWRLYLLMETICATGIRVSELRFITVQALRSRQATVRMKGKTRTVLLPEALCKELRQYAAQRGLKSGSVFVTRSGLPMDRSNILHAMKALCRLAQVAASKVFPHNLRHLFAVTFYKAERNICHLADLLGHSNINTTRIYTTVSRDEQRRCIERLGLLDETEEAFGQKNAPHNICYAVISSRHGPCQEGGAGKIFRLSAEEPPAGARLQARPRESAAQRTNHGGAGSDGRAAWAGKIFPKAGCAQAGLLKRHVFLPERHDKTVEIF